ncbi:Uncharacterised protein [Mycobacteroides abscessus subsp. abscessus]|uniref:Uncharacterized protein n=1 Tax=Mycobacteroides abscessus TaxID=36809 RepID=A0A0U0ZNA0_9MYCO|nr:Uncharacterised protein [Mycobacteroides abscessus]SHP80505.1 Uncharacterised protein [Mycobacteroides abscessus subsp. abscessus]SKN12792.1 Uncharacterised protein [Mycobacteroides abscessus subsp. massiliense]CPU08818.1 Uncharacterised protein [Mycobacteroides abscessus]CPV58294.1 Uncharacterised protein [Mycobacteroides abscessus]
MMPASASPKPNVPLVDSTIMAPGLRSPRALACSIICSAGRSFMPLGLWPSSLAQKPVPGVEKGSDTHSTGVLPTNVLGSWNLGP